MLRALGTAPGNENRSNFTADCPLPTAHCRLPTIFTINGHGGGAAAPGDENAMAVSGGWDMVGATPEDRPVVAGSGAPDLFGEAENELMCPAS